MATWQDKLRKIAPYVPGEQPDDPTIIKLNTNENPYPPAPGVQKAVEDYKADPLRLYPNTQALPIVKALAEFYGRKEEEIFVGVGSDDVLATAFMSMFDSKEPVLFPDITYSFYDVWAELFRVPYKQIPLGEDFRIRKEDYYGPNGGVVIANPNAPTSLLEPVSVIEDIIQHNPDSVVIVDEAYVDFGGESVIPLIDKYPNLLVVQTFSKARSMAGMRVGYAIGNPKLIQAMNDVKYSYNSYTMNHPSMAFAVEAVKDKAYFEETLAKVIKTREWTKKELERLGFEVLDSKTNFLFAAPTKLPAEEVFTKLRERKILVRYFKKPRIDKFLRITIGTDEQMQKMIEALEEIFE